MAEHEAGIEQRDEEMEQHIARVVDALTEKFNGIHDPETVASVVAEARAKMEAEARVTKYLPVLVSRRAADKLAGRRPRD